MSDRPAAPPVDDAARRAAQTELDRPFVLEAGAGTGKTTTLVGRLLAWSLGPGWERAAAEERRPRPRSGRSERRGAPPAPDSLAVAARTLGGVVAITFTEAAAAEMASRVGGELAAIAASGGEVPGWLHLAPADGPGDGEAAPGERRAERARALLGALDQLTVRTIHAFCRGLLAAYPLEAGLHPDLVVDADGRVLDEVVRTAVEERLGAAYGEAPDEDFLALAERGFGPPEIAEAVAALATAGLPAAALGEDPCAPDHVAALAGRFAAAARRLHVLVAPRLGASGRVKSARAVADGLAALLRPLEGLAEDGSTADLPILLAWVAESGLAGQKRLRDWRRGPSGKTEEELLGEVSGELRAAARELCRLLDHAAALDPELLERARRALAPLLAEVQEEMRRRGAATFHSLLTGAADLLAQHPEVRRRVRSSIDQLLVDELQDTDRLQCAIIGWIALDGLPAERPGLFLVGDPKQSIYGWRSADLGAYDDLVARVLDAGGRRERLTESFRSVPAVLEEVTRVVGPVMERRPGVQPAFERLVPTAVRAAEAGFRRAGRAPVEHWLSWCGEDGERPGGAATRSADADALEAAAIAADIAELHTSEEVPWSCFALLFRSTGSLETYLEALRRAGVPFVVARDKQYYRRREIIEAAALVRAILDPGDHLALVSFLRSPLVGVPDAAWIPLWTRGFPRLATELSGARPESVERLRAVVREAAAALPRDVPGLGRVAGWELNLEAALEALARLRLSFDRDPADRFVENLRTWLLPEATAAARYLGAYRLANLERFFRELLATLDGGGDTAALLRLLRTSISEAAEAEEARPREAAEDAVQVMTIHKAKGLDFQHVYLPQLHHNQPDGGGPSTEVAAGDDGPEYRLLGAPTPGFDRVAARRREVEAAERVRLLYVAMTRARDRLVLAGKWPARPSTGGAAAVERARNLLDLVAGRPDLPAPSPAELWEAAGAQGAWRLPDPTGALWVLPALAPDASAGAGRSAPASAAAATGPFPTAAVAAAERTLASHRRRAARRMERPFSGPASAEAHARLEADEVRGEPADAGPDAPPATPRRALAQRTRAQAVGSAVHRFLEAFDPRAELDAELARLAPLLEAALAAEAPPTELDEARQQVTGLLRRLAGSRLLGRLREIGDAVVARELPVLLPAADGEGDAGGPVGFIAGAVDLLYRDPASGEWVVADYKTDRVASEEEIGRRAAAYASQGSVYTRAVREALGLARPPRFELWFLAADRVVPVEADLPHSDG